MSLEYELNLSKDIIKAMLKGSSYKHDNATIYGLHAFYQKLERVLIRNNCFHLYLDEIISAARSGKLAYEIPAIETKVQKPRTIHFSYSYNYNNELDLITDETLLI